MAQISPLNSFVERQNQPQWHDYYKCDDPKHQCDSTGRFEGDAEEFCQNEHGDDLHSSSYARNLDDASQADEAEQNDHVGDSQVMRRRKGLEYAAEGGGDQAPLDDGVDDQERGPRAAAHGFHALTERMQGFRNPGGH